MDDGPSDYQHIWVNAFAPNLGAEIRGVNISRDISDAEFAEINGAFLKHQVLFLRNKRKSLHQGMWLLAKNLGDYILILQRQQWTVTQKSSKSMPTKTPK